MTPVVRDVVEVTRRVVPTIGGLAVLIFWIMYGPGFAAAATATPRAAAVLLFTIVQLYLMIRIVLRTARILNPGRVVHTVEYAHSGAAVAVRGVPETDAGPIPDTLAVAKHEAAHAVVTLVLGHQVRRVEVFTDGTITSGRTSGHALTDAPDAALFWDLLRIKMAGHVWDVTHGVFNEGSHKDWNEALMYAACVTSVGQAVPGLPDGEMDPMKAIMAARVDVAAILDANAVWIESVGSVLAAAGALTEVQLWALRPGAGDVPTSVLS